MWNGHGIGTYLDEYIAGHGEDNWLNDLASEAFPGSGDPGSFGCGSRDQSCFTGLGIDDCQALSDADRGADYWIFNSAQKLQVRLPADRPESIHVS